MASIEGPIRVLHVSIDEPGGVDRHIASIERHLPAEISSRRILVPPGGGSFSPATLKRVRSAIAGEDLIHAHGTRAAFVSWAASLLSRPSPMVVTIHGLHLLRRTRGLRNWLARRASKWLFARFEWVYVLSESDGELLTEIGVTRVTKIDQPFEPMQPADRTSSRRTLDVEDATDLVLWVGRFVDMKDPLLFVRAASIARDPNRVFAMAGDGPLRPDAERLAAQEAANVRFLGWLEDPAIAYSAADVCVSTSRWEGLPLALLEAASCGCFVVATDVAGNRDAIAAGLPGVLVPSRDPDAIAEAIDGALGASDRVGLQPAAIGVDPEQWGMTLATTYRDALAERSVDQ